MNIFSKKIFTKAPNVFFENNEYGAYQRVLAPGNWKITMIGGGGYSEATLTNSTSLTFNYAKGGVGGTLIFKLTNPAAQLITINVGEGGGHNMSLVGADVPSTDSSITGFSGLTAIAGRGIEASSVSSAGTMGANTINADFPIDIILNNPNTIISAKGSAQISVATQPNANYEANTNFGAGAGAGYAKSGNFIMSQNKGSNGYVKIEKA